MVQCWLFLSTQGAPFTPLTPVSSSERVSLEATSPYQNKVCSLCTWVLLSEHVRLPAACCCALIPRSLVALSRGSPPHPELASVTSTVQIQYVRVRASSGHIFMCLCPLVPPQPGLPLVLREAPLLGPAQGWSRAQAFAVSPHCAARKTKCPYSRWRSCRPQAPAHSWLWGNRPCLESLRSQESVCMGVILGVIHLLSEKGNM